MAYVKQTWQTGQTVTATKLNHMEDGISAADTAAASAATAASNAQATANGKYSKPADGIPKSDLASEVQDSLGLADTALQTHQDISGKLDASAVTHETWTFTLEDDTTVTKEVVLWAGA